MPTTVHITEYAPPVLRAASPASSVGTVYGEDQTSLSDLELNDAALARKYEDLLELRKPRKEEEEANQFLLLERPEKGSQAEKELYEKTMVSLRRQIRDLEDDEIFDQMLLRGSQAGLVQPPSSNDIDKLMRSMMGPDVQTISSIAHKARGVLETETVAPGPWLKKNPPVVSLLDPDDESEIDAESVLAAIRTREVEP
ncbi:hypothetical protein M378DRAFT_169814 [Amanita muscaria Koide BX008]|uniref:Uncharacterized protein n=1 Tax=Amanita muscaria (strain Koide BX008) TaxID=946122 RepID=A0A0C2SY61_AMAMK|nr:hypothetical protein M378DRAFT_169814 [Amanita muscaria Koide BX008]